MYVVREGNKVVDVGMEVSEAKLCVREEEACFYVPLEPTIDESP